jgi:hypothetical protein
MEQPHGGRCWIDINVPPRPFEQATPLPELVTELAFEQSGRDTGEAMACSSVQNLRARNLVP